MTKLREIRPATPGKEKIYLSIFRRWSAMAARYVDDAIAMRDFDEREIESWSTRGDWFIARRSSSAMALNGNNALGKLTTGPLRPLRLVGRFSDEMKARARFEVIRCELKRGSVILVDPDSKIERYASERTREALRELIHVVLGFHLKIRGRSSVHVARVLHGMGSRDLFVSRESFAGLRESARIVRDSTPRPERPHSQTSETGAGV